MEKYFSIPATKMAADDATLKAKREELKKKLINAQTTPLNELKFDSKGNVMGDGKNSTGVIPDTKLAVEDAAAKKRREIRDALLKQKKLSPKELKFDGKGNVMGDGKNTTGVIPETKLAAEDAMAKKRRELREKLIASTKTQLNELKFDGKGNVMGDGKNTTGVIPDTKLAALQQWYEVKPELLQAEKAAMHKLFPDFTLGKLDDGRLYWSGSLNIGVLGDNEWHVMAVYDNNHPVQKMGSSVKVYLVEPDINELIADLGWRPHHLLVDSNNNIYLCTTEAEYVKADVNKSFHSAASVMGWAIKWLLAFELVLTGDLSVEDFNTPGKI